MKAERAVAPLALVVAGGGHPRGVGGHRLDVVHEVGPHWWTVAAALRDDFFHEVFGVARSPTLVNRKGKRPRGAVVKVPVTGAAPSASTW